MVTKISFIGVVLGKHVTSISGISTKIYAKEPLRFENSFQKLVEFCD